MTFGGKFLPESPWIKPRHISMIKGKNRQLACTSLTCFAPGAIYCDGGLLSKGFNGEGVVGPSVVVVKSHSVRPKFNIFKDHRQDGSKIYFDAAVVLLRNPKNAMIAEWHRRKTKRMVNSSVSNHFLSTGRQDFGMLAYCHNGGM